MVQCRFYLRKADMNAEPWRFCDDLRKRSGVEIDAMLPDHMRAAAVTADHALANLGRDREVGQSPFNR